MSRAASSGPGFVVRLDEFRFEVWRAARYLYSGWAIEHAAGRSPRVEHALNESSRFWHSVMAACQDAGYLALGRIFDQHPRAQYTVDKLLRSATKEIAIFSRRALKQRHISDAGGVELPRLAEWLQSTHEPSLVEFQELHNKVDEKRRLFKRLVYPVRNMALAHRQLGLNDDVEALYRGGTNAEVWELVAFLIELHHSLDELYRNGHPVKFRKIPMGLDQLFAADPGLSLPQSWVVDDVGALLDRLCDGWRTGTALDRSQPTRTEGVVPE